MRKEPSDIVALLKRLGHELSDNTCRQFHDLAARDSMPVLDLCHAAIATLAAEKAHLLRRLMDDAAMRGPAPIVLTAEQAAKLDLSGVRIETKKAPKPEPGAS